jgi:acetylornithine deacetylase/succinyl-diaminopimelate desuccinylase-like protein
MTSSASSGSETFTADSLRERVKGLMPQAREDLSRAVSFRSVADGTQPEECERMVEWTIQAFSGVGLEDVRAYQTADGSKTVLGHLPGPQGAPTVLLYFHHDVQPASEAGWESPAWQLTERDGRWYGRGAADCKGSMAAHLAAIRALQGEPPVTLKIVGEGSEEQGTGGLEQFVRENPDLLRADAILVCDTGNVAVGVPTLTTSLRGMARVWVTVRTLESPVHSGMFGGAAPDALAALIRMLATLRDDQGATTVRGVDGTQRWPGAPYSPEQFRGDAGVLEGVDLLGDEVADTLWARPTATVLGIDCPPVEGSPASVPHEARARIDLRIQPGVDPQDAQSKLIEHLREVAPWHVQLDFRREAHGAPFQGSTAGPGFESLERAMRDSYGRDVTLQGQGGSIPLCTAFQETFPDAEIMLLGVEEPKCLIHAANESVDPTEIERIALAEALFLHEYARATAA